MKHTIVLVDDHPVFRQGLYHLLSKEEDLTVVGEAGDGQMAIDQVRRKRPDLVVMDINMPNLDGIEAARQILSEAPEAKVVALSVHSGKQFVRNMIQAGASGYILKESIPEEMIAGIRSVLSGDIYLSKSISKILVSDYKTLASESTPEPDGISTPILYTKLHRPPISSAIIPRVRLLEMLENGVHHPMTLIAAPAGYGKSILASQWIEASKLPGAWVSLDESDNDLRVFLSYILEAIQTMLGDHKLRTRALLAAPNLPSLEVTARYLLNDLELLPKRSILVVDDYHLIRNATVHDLLMELLVHPSPKMHLALLTRRDPPLPLISLRSRGMLTEISAKDLRFTAAETKSFLERYLRITISDKTAQVLEEKMEGWVTGLHLAALSIRNEADQDRLIAGLLETSQYVRDYMIQEVLSYVPPQYNQYLLRTAILDRFCAPLCEAISPEDSKRNHIEAHVSGLDFIDWLIKRNLLVIPLDKANRWFRYHHMFQELLQNHLKQRCNTKEIAELHFRASEWYESHDLIDEAIHHALAARDFVRAAEIIERHRHDKINLDRWYVAGRWLDLLPPKIIQQRPVLLLTQAWKRFNQFRLLEIPELLEQASALLTEETADESLLGELDFHWGYLSIWLQGDGKAALKHLENARSRLPEAYRELVAETEFDIALARHMIGDGESAIESLEEKIRTTISSDPMLMTRLVGAQVFIYLMSGDLKCAMPPAQRLKSVAKEDNNTHVVAWSNYLLALAQLQSYQLDEALQNFLIAAEQRDIIHRKSAVEALVGLVLTYQAMQRTDDAVDAMKQLLEFAQGKADPQHVAVAESCRARLALLVGDLTSANRWALSFDAEPHAPSACFWLEVPLITQARIRIAAGTQEGLARALESLGSLGRQGTALHFTCLTIEIAVLQSVALEKLGRADEAIAALEETVALAGPLGWVRPFVEAGPVMVDLLQRLRVQNVSVDYIDKLLAAFPDDGKTAVPDSLDSKSAEERSLSTPSPSRPVSSFALQPLVEPLTNRELDVLELLAERLQNKEIADKLFISAETVKGHLKNIYLKLGVNDRRQAVKRVKALGIL